MHQKVIMPFKQEPPAHHRPPQVSSNMSSQSKIVIVSVSFFALILGLILLFCPQVFSHQARPPFFGIQIGLIWGVCLQQDPHRYSCSHHGYQPKPKIITNGKISWSLCTKSHSEPTKPTPTKCFVLGLFFLGSQSGNHPLEDVRIK